MPRTIKPNIQKDPKKNKAKYVLIEGNQKHSKCAEKFYACSYNGPI